MGNLLDRGTDWMLRKLDTGASVDMTYRRGSLAVGLTVTRGRTEYAAYDDEGNLITEVTDASFVVPAAALVLSGAITEPRPGDRLEEVHETGVRHYEVMPRGGHKCFSRDPSNQLLRIHTKLIKAP